MGHPQWGKYARCVLGVTSEPDCDWDTVNDAVDSYGETLLDNDRHRFGFVTVLGLDEAFFVREGPYRRPHFSTSNVDVGTVPLLYVGSDRSDIEQTAWLVGQ